MGELTTVRNKELLDAVANFKWRLFVSMYASLPDPKKVKDVAIEIEQFYSWAELCRQKMFEMFSLVTLEFDSKFTVFTAMIGGTDGGNPDPWWYGMERRTLVKTDVRDPQGALPDFDPDRERLVAKPPEITAQAACDRFLDKANDGLGIWMYGAWPTLKLNVG